MLETNLTTITTGPGFLGNFVLLLLKTCSLYHEKLFIQVVNDISSQVFNNFFSASDIMEAVRGRFRVWYEGCVIQVILLQNKWVGIGIKEAHALCRDLADRPKDRRHKGQILAVWFQTDLQPLWQNLCLASDSKKVKQNLL